MRGRRPRRRRTGSRICWQLWMTLTRELRRWRRLYGNGDEDVSREIAESDMIRKLACYWLQRMRNNRRWKELTKIAREDGNRRVALYREFWREWSSLSTAGRDAYWRRDTAEANQLFKASSAC